MGHFYVRNGENYLYHRRNNGKLYESRATYGPDPGQARVFTQWGAATTAAKEVGWTREHVRRVRLMEVSDEN